MKRLAIIARERNKTMKILKQALAILLTLLLCAGVAGADQEIINGVQVTTGGVWTAGADVDLDGGKLILDADGDSYLVESADDQISIYTGGTELGYISYGSALLVGKSSFTPGIILETSSSTNPTLVPMGLTDIDTGLGGPIQDQLSLISGSVEGQRIVEANSVIYHIFGSTQQDTVTNATTNGTTTITKAGENFLTTCQVGDAVLIWSGTTTADYGVYWITTVTDDANLVLNTAPTGSDADVDFYVFRGGMISTGERTYYLEGTATAGETPDIIGSIHEAALGDRLTFGVDEATRMIVICDAGDAETDLGLSAKSVPTLIFLDNDISHATSISQISDTFSITSTYGANNDIRFSPRQRIVARLEVDNSATNFFDVVSDTGIELTNDDAVQSFLYVEPKIRQTNTAAYNGLQIKVTETALGSGATGTGGTNNLLVAGTSTDDDMFKVDNVGRIVLAESSAPAALADHAFLYAKDNAGTGALYAADAAATEHLLTSHYFPLFTPPADDPFPISMYAENRALGKVQNFDISGALKDLEAITGKKYRHYADIPAKDQIDLSALQQEQWRREWIAENTTEAETTAAEALEVYDAEVPATETVPGESKEVWIPKKIGEKPVYSLDDAGEVVEGKAPVFETKAVTKTRLKKNCRLDNATGKFYRATVENKKVVSETEITKAEAVETYSVEVPVKEKVTVTGKPKVRKKRIGEKVVGYELQAGAVIEKKEPVFEMVTEKRKRLKADCRFDKATGKFYQTVKPTKAQTDAAVAAGFQANIPAWLAERLK